MWEQFIPVILFKTLPVLTILNRSIDVIEINAT